MCLPSLLSNLRLITAAIPGRNKMFLRQNKKIKKNTIEEMEDSLPKSVVFGGLSREQTLTLVSIMNQQ